MAEIINVNELKPGITFVKDNQPYVVLDASHSKQARGQAHVTTKAKNLETGSTINITFVGGEKIEKAFVEKKDMQFLYTDENNGMFMDETSFEQFEIPRQRISEQLKYMKEGISVIVTSFNGKVLGVETTKNVTLKVVETADAVKGNTIGAAMKKAVLETGIEIDVPQFINQGEEIIVNSDNGTYVGKA